MKSQLCGEIVADARDEDILWVEGIPYFPPDSVTPGALEPSQPTSTRLWRGLAERFDVLVAGARVDAGAWSYARPLPAAVAAAGADFSRYIAFALTDIEVTCGRVPPSRDPQKVPGPQPGAAGGRGAR